jgi:hypothetical protein
MKQLDELDEDGIMGRTGVYGIYDNHAPGLNGGHQSWGITRQGTSLETDIPRHRGGQGG